MKGLPRVFPCLVGVAALALSGLSVSALASPAPDEQAFEAARRYTVKVRTQVELPFYGDKKGTHTGAGFVVDARRGWVLTNAHVTARSPSQVRLAFHGGDYVPARKLYVDPYVDLAVIEIAPKDRPVRLDVAELDCRGLPAIGHAVGAFGHPWELSYTGTRGIISGVTARFAGQLEMLQTDAPINPGNSGGPLISLKTGKVVGINTATRKSSQNTNFAVPMPHACRVLELLRAGRDPSPPELTVAFLKDVDETRRLVVARVYEEAAAGLREGDVIRRIGGESADVENRGQLIHLLRGRLDAAELRIARGDREMTVQLSFRPAESATGRRGVYASGALFAATPWNDLGELVNPRLAIMVHHVERGSPADAQRIEAMDLLVTVDGAAVIGVEDLHGRLATAEKAGRPVALKLLRLGDIEDSLFSYIERPLAVSQLRMVGRE